jgi:hypothetical protein
MRDIYLPLILDVEGINLEEVIMLSDKRVRYKLNDEGKNQSKSFCNFLIGDDGQYIVNINYYSSNYSNHPNHIKYKYYVGKDDIRKIFYNALSYGVIPRHEIIIS